MQTPRTDPGTPLPEPGTIVDDRYEVISMLGSGGFAKVFRGEDLRLGRPVAIKFLAPATMPPDADGWRVMTERFRREAKATSRIRHPSLIEVYDLGLYKDRHYIVMELLHGRDLADELRQVGPMGAARVLGLFDRALCALGRCHRHDPVLIHRDLKPSNLFLIDAGTADEDIRILDFGIAYIDAPGPTLTSTHQIVGTPGYLAPEYIRAQIVSPALDVYQMGLILTECLLGRRVVDADSAMGCVAQHLERSFEMPLPLLASPLGPVLLRALAPVPDARYSDAQDFREALAQIDPASIPPLTEPLHSRPIWAYDAAPCTEAEQPGPAQTQTLDRPAPPGRPFPWAGLVAAALAAGMVCAGVLGWSAWSRNWLPVGVEPAAPETAETTTEPVKVEVKQVTAQHPSPGPETVPAVPADSAGPVVASPAPAAPSEAPAVGNADAGGSEDVPRASPDRADRRVDKVRSRPPDPDKARTRPRSGKPADSPGKKASSWLAD